MENELEKAFKQHDGTRASNSVISKYERDGLNQIADQLGNYMSEAQRKNAIAFLRDIAEGNLEDLQM